MVVGVVVLCCGVLHCGVSVVVAVVFVVGFVFGVGVEDFVGPHVLERFECP